MTACVLVFAGLDPSGGAGLLADAEAIREAGARPLCIATALTVQSTARAVSFEPVGPSLVREAARALLEEEDVRAVKIGMVADDALAEAIGALLPDLPVVVDPVLAASSGAPLFRGDGAGAYRALMRGRIVTPNIPEAAALLGLRDAPSQEVAARLLIERGAAAALVKGGHAQGDAIDVLAWVGGVERYGAARVAVERRGTGCRLASALAARLAAGDALPQAAARAKDQVRRYLLS